MSTVSPDIVFCKVHNLQRLERVAYYVRNHVCRIENWLTSRVEAKQKKKEKIGVQAIGQLRE